MVVPSVGRVVVVRVFLLRVLHPRYVYVYQSLILIAGADLVFFWGDQVIRLISITTATISLSS